MPWVRMNSWRVIFLGGMPWVVFDKTGGVGLTGGLGVSGTGEGVGGIGGTVVGGGVGAGGGGVGGGGIGGLGGLEGVTGRFTGFVVKVKSLLSLFITVTYVPF